MDEKNDYDVKPENNMPRMVYGIPREDYMNYNVSPRNNVPAKVYGVKRVKNIDTNTNALDNFTQLYKLIPNEPVLTESFLISIDKYTIEKIKDNEIDLFWSNSARDVLKIIIIIDLINYNEINEEKLIKQLENTEELKKYLLENLNKLSTSYFKNSQFNTKIINTDKPFESAVQLIKDAYEN